MKKITLPKWAVVQSLDGGRMIHIGDGQFVSADAHLPKVIETCRPKNAAEVLPEIITPDDAEYEVQWELGSMKVEQSPEPEEPVEE